MTAYELRWPDPTPEAPHPGTLLLIAIDPSVPHAGHALPCRVVGTLTPGSPFAQPEAAAPSERISALLTSIGVPTNLRGFTYLRAALTLSAAQPEILRSLNRTLYPAIARQHAATPNAVERAIRHAIAQTWARGGGDRCRQLLGRSFSCVGDRPSNGEFLTLLAEYLARGR